MISARATQPPLQSRYALGIDVGGTKIAGGIVDLDSGTVLGRRQVATDYERGGAAILADTSALAQDLKAEAARLGKTPLALGLGVAELVSPQGQIFSDHRIRWTGLDVAGALSTVLPTVISADVRAAALAEARYGVGRGLSSFYFVTIGTGISGVLVLDGVPYAGSRGAALVIANGPVICTCPQCGHLVRHVVEDIASGPALAAAYAAGCRSEDVLRAAQTGDAQAIAVIDHAAQALGQVLALLVNALDPAKLVIGGGLGSAPGLYLSSIARSVRARLWDGYRSDIPILQAALGADAGLIGAAAATTFPKEPVHRQLTAT